MTVHARLRDGAPDSGEYAAACGRVRALEKRLLGPGSLETLLEAHDVPMLLRELRQHGTLAAAAGEAKGSWEDDLERSLAATDRLLVSIDPRPLVTRLLTLRADLVNLGSLLRARAAGMPFPGPWLARGVHEREQLETAVRRGDFALYPEPLAGELAAAADPGGEAPGRAGSGADRAWWRALLAAARAAGSGFFVDWLGHRADLANLLARLRVFAAPEAWPPGFEPLPGGHLGEGLFAAAATAEELLAATGRTAYGAVVARARAHGELSLVALERAADDFLVSLLEPARGVALGPEPLWAYHLARENEARNVRALVRGALAGLDVEARRRLLRRPYGSREGAFRA